MFSFYTWICLKAVLICISDRYPKQSRICWLVLVDIRQEARIIGSHDTFLLRAFVITGYQTRTCLAFKVTFLANAGASILSLLNVRLDGIFVEVAASTLETIWGIKTDTDVIVSLGKLFDCNYINRSRRCIVVRNWLV